MSHQEPADRYISITIGLAAIVFLCWLPVSWAEPSKTIIEPGADEIVESFYVHVPEDVIAISHRGDLPIAAVPPDIAKLEEANLENGVAILTKVRDAAGEIIGFGAQLEVVLEGNAPNGDQIQATNWILVIPGRGTVYLSELEAIGDFGTKILRPVIESGQDWEGEFMRIASAGPRADGRGEISAGTFEFAEMKGSFVEIQNYKKVTADGKLFTTTELRLFKKSGNDED